MKIALIDKGNTFPGGKLPNLALMKLSAYYKQQGAEVVLNPPTSDGIDKTHVSIIFTKDKESALAEYSNWPGVDFGGTGYSLTKDLPEEVEILKPDYDLYTAAEMFPRLQNRIATDEAVWQKSEVIVNSGIGYTSRGCVRTCKFCAVPQKEGALRSVGTIADLINPRSNLITILDNNLTADPDVFEKLKEIRERGLVANITQGIDVRLVTDQLAHELNTIKLYQNQIFYAWDIPKAESIVTKGIKRLSKALKPYKHGCYVLTGFDSTFEEDMHRINTLWHTYKVRPFVMVYLNPKEENNPRTAYQKTRLHHIQRWVNGKFFKKIKFEEYTPWLNAQKKLPGAFGAKQSPLIFSMC